LPIRDGVVTGEVEEPIVDGERKALLLRELAQREGISLEQTIAVGDGANDLPMLSIAGLGVAFRAKPLVQQSATQAISTLGLAGRLYLVGCGDGGASGAPHPRQGRAGARPSLGSPGILASGNIEHQLDERFSRHYFSRPPADNWLRGGQPSDRDRTAWAEPGAVWRSATPCIPVRYSWEKLKFMLSLGGCR